MSYSIFYILFISLHLSIHIRLFRRRSCPNMAAVQTYCITATHNSVKCGINVFIYVNKNNKVLFYMYNRSEVLFKSTLCCTWVFALGQFQRKTTNGHNVQNQRECAKQLPFKYCTWLNRTPWRAMTTSKAAMPHLIQHQICMLDLVSVKERHILKITLYW